MLMWALFLGLCWFASGVLGWTFNLKCAAGWLHLFLVGVANLALCFIALWIICGAAWKPTNRTRLGQPNPRS
jgi:hypothetical protein